LMVGAPMSRVVQGLRHAAMARDGGGITDGQLLDCFLADGDEGAFAALVRRHGPMVMGVCRRLLGNSHDAEDAFQASFVVLARKAAGVVPREFLGHWLYGVAYRTALKARTVAMRRRGLEMQVKHMPEPQAPQTEPCHDLEAVLDFELNRLPDKYRIPVVLCEMEGKSKREIARFLGVPEGTISSRLARARQMLRKRLTQRGLALSAAAMAFALSVGAVSASVPALLVVSTSKAATSIAAGGAATGAVSANVAALTKGVLKAMLIAKLKIVAAISLVLAIAGLGMGDLAYHSVAAQQAPLPVSRSDDAKKNASPAVGSPAISASGLHKRLEAGHWYLTNADLDKKLISVCSIPHRPTTLGITPKGILHESGQDLVLEGLTVASDAKVLLDGKEAVLSDLKKDTLLRLTFAPGNATVARISAVSSRRDLMLKSIDVEQNAVTVVFHTEEITLPVRFDAKFSVLQRPVKVTELKAGTCVTLRLGPDGDRLAVTEIRVNETPVGRMKDQGGNRRKTKVITK
jgi:RNA polymerase sigma factor (sigma-70 family)